MRDFVIKRERMLPHQKSWWDLDNYIKLLVGGFGCGKTYIGALRSIYLSYANTPYPIQYVSPSYKMAKKTIIPTLYEILSRNNMNFEYNRTDSIFHILEWDGHIWIGSGDDPDSLRGPNLAAAGIDEPFIQDKMVFDIMMSRVRHPDAKQREIFLTGTPESLNWGYEIAINEDNRYDIGVVRGSTLDNPYLPPEYSQSLLSGYTPEMVQAYVHGHFVNLNAGRVYLPFDRIKHCVHKDDISNLEIVAGIDFNVDYLSAEIARYCGSFVHFFDEIRLSNSNTYELANKLKAKYPAIRVFPDPTGSARKTSASKTDHQILRDNGFTVISKSNVKPRDRINAINGLILKNALTIETGTCPYLVADLEREVWRNGEPDQTSDPARTHSSSAAGYMIDYLFPILKSKAWSIKR